MIVSYSGVIPETKIVVDENTTAVIGDIIVKKIGYKKFRTDVNYTLVVDGKTVSKHVSRVNNGEFEIKEVE